MDSEARITPKITIKRTPTLFLFLSLMLAAPQFATYFEKAPLGEDKFVHYGGPDFSIDTELQGRIVGISGTTLFIVPYPNYDHLAWEGNRIHPRPDENHGGYDWYRDNILPYL